MKAIQFLPELSTDLLARYKKAAYADAKKADAEGDFDRGNKRFKGINKATTKQFDNDAKKYKQSVVEDSEPTNREFALVKKLGRLGVRIVQNPKLWAKYTEAIDNDNLDWVVSLIQEGTGADKTEVINLDQIFGEIGGGTGRITDFAWAVKEGTWEQDFMNPYRQYKSQGVAEGWEEIAEWLAEEGKASRALCQGGKPDSQLGASQLASCKSQGLRARDGEKSHLIGKGGSKVRVTVGGKKIKGKKYGGPLPDYGTRKGQI